MKIGDKPLASLGDTFTYKYQRTEKQFKLGQRVQLETLAFVVEATNVLEASGKVINTYGHKRTRKKPQ